MNQHAVNWRKYIVVLLVCILLGSTMAYAGEQPKYGGTLRVGLFNPPDRLDARDLGIPALNPAATMIYDGLFTWGKRGYQDLAPALATSYETKDNKVWIFRLRKGVKFHNGREMTSDDVKKNLDWRIKAPEGWKPIWNRELIKGLKRVDIIDKYSIRITLENPFSILPRMLTYAMSGVAPQEEIEKWGDQINAHPCGTGPFKMSSYKPGEELVLERFEQYWGPKPYLDKVIYKFYRSDETRLMALQKGELDLAIVFDDARPTLDKDPNLAYQINPLNDTLRKAYFNMRRWPMNDIRFRMAVWKGVDWKNVSINAFAFKSGIPARSLLDGTKYFNPAAEKLVPPYNPEEARKLIQAVEKDAGKKIPPIYWLDSTASQARNVGEMAKAQLSEIGVPLNLNFLSTATWSDKISKDPKIEWDIAIMGVGFALEPSLGFTLFISDSNRAPDGKSLGGYINPTFDQLIKKAETGKEKDAKKLYNEAEIILLKDAAVIPFFLNRHVVAYNKKVKGFEVKDTGNLCITTGWGANVWLQQ